MSNVKRECKVIMLATKNREISNIGILNNDKLYCSNIKEFGFKPQHLYIISDDEIELNDWVYNSTDNILLQFNNLTGCILANQQKEKYGNKTYHKVIATTNNKISINLGKEKWVAPTNSTYDQIYTRLCPFPQPSQQFIEKYVEEYNKGNVIDRVMVEYDIDISKSPYTSSKMNRVLKVMLKSLGDKLIPKINPKDNTITISKIKDSWNREEVINLLYKHTEELLSDNKKSLEDWIEENL